MNFLMNLLKKKKIKDIEVNEYEKEIYGTFHKNIFVISKLDNNKFKIVINNILFNNLNNKDIEKKIKTLKSY